MDSLLAFAEKLLLLWASIPGTYRPGAEGKPASWEALLSDVLTVERGWPLSLLVAGWYLRDRRQVASQALGALRGINGVSLIWLRFDSPRIRAALETACKDAFEAKASWELAGAAASFDFVLKDASGLNLAEALANPGFRSLTRSILEALPPPANLAARLKAALDGQPAPSVAAAPAPIKAPAAPARPVPPVPAKSAGTGPRPAVTSISTPQLSEYDHCSAYLASRGYTPEQIEKICGGPERGSSGDEA